MIKGWRGKLRPKVGFSREQRPIGIQRGHDGATQAVGEARTAHGTVISFLFLSTVVLLIPGAWR